MQNQGKFHRLFGWIFSHYLAAEFSGFINWLDKISEFRDFAKIEMHFWLNSLWTRLLIFSSWKAVIHKVNQIVTKGAFLLQCMKFPISVHQEWFHSFEIICKYSIRFWRQYASETKMNTDYFWLFTFLKINKEKQRFYFKISECEVRWKPDATDNNAFNVLAGE